MKAVRRTVWIQNFFCLIPDILTVIIFRKDLSQTKMLKLENITSCHFSVTFGNFYFGKIIRVHIINNQRKAYFCMNLERIQVICRFCAKID